MHTKLQTKIQPNTQSFNLTSRKEISICTIILIRSNNILVITVHSTSCSPALLLHCTTLNDTSFPINFTLFHFTSRLVFIPFKFSTTSHHHTSFHFTSLHYISLHFTSLHFNKLLFYTPNTKRPLLFIRNVFQLCRKPRRATRSSKHNMTTLVVGTAVHLSHCQRCYTLRL